MFFQDILRQDLPILFLQSLCITMQGTRIITSSVCDCVVFWFILDYQWTLHSYDFTGMEKKLSEISNPVPDVPQPEGVPTKWSGLKLLFHPYCKLMHLLFSKLQQRTCLLHTFQLQKRTGLLTQKLEN